MKLVQIFILAALVVYLVSLAGCVPGDGKHTTSRPAGFFWGIWHGWIAPICLVWERFNPSIRLYEASNTGWWYDFGFYIAIIGGFGGLSLIRRKKSNK